MLTNTIEADGDGWIHLSDEPGLGITLNEEVLQQTASAQATFS
jgi:L-alanine-DL-glutamate epimerase-like enolase superfamily enzyme